MKGTSAETAIHCLEHKIRKDFNDDKIPLTLCDILEFLLLHDKLPQGLTEKEQDRYQVCLKEVRDLIETKHKYMTAIDELKNLSEYNDIGKINGIVKNLLIP